MEETQEIALRFYKHEKKSLRWLKHSETFNVGAWLTVAIALISLIIPTTTIVIHTIFTISMICLIGSILSATKGSHYSEKILQDINKFQEQVQASSTKEAVRLLAKEVEKIRDKLSC